MKSIEKQKTVRAILGGILSIIIGTSAASAVPYATGVTNNGTSISFRLNESADVVKVIYNGGAATVNLGALPAGVTTTNLTIVGDFKVEVTKTAGAGYDQGVALQISSDSNPFVQFEQPIGVAVNKNPASPYFGRIYVANSRPNATVTGRTAGDGIFVLNPDFSDGLGQNTNALTAGFNFVDATQNTTAPWRLEVGEDDNLYIANWTTNSGTILVTDPNVSTGTNVLDGFGTPGVSPTASSTHGQIASSVLAYGSLAQSNLTLYALDGDLFPINGLRRFDVAEGPLPSLAEPVDLTGFASPLLQISRVIVDLDRGPDGKFYLSQYRSTGNEGGLFVVDTQDNDGDTYLDVIYSSLGNTREITGDFSTNDFLKNTYCIKVSPDGSKIALGRNDGPTWIIPLINGIPDLVNRVQISTAAAGPTRDVCFDAAGNLYMVNNNIERLRVFSPGGRWVATTGTDGTFSVTNPPLAKPEINLSAAINSVYERISAGQAVLKVTRVGDTSADLTVNLSLSGTAANGVDYQTIASTITIPAGSASASVSLQPIDNSNVTGNKTAIVTLASSPDYDILSSANSVTVSIVDDESQQGAVLFADDFDTDTSANWSIKFGAASGEEDYRAIFSFDYGAEGIPPAPHSAGTTKGLLLAANKNDTTAAAAAVNVYAAGKNFTGDYAFRADAYMSVGSDAAGTTEHTLFGINHSGTKTNRHGVTGTDGLWFAIDTDATDNRGLGFYGTTDSTAPTLLKNNSEFIGVYPNPPWAYAGATANLTNKIDSTGSGRYWADVEVRQVNNVVTMKINNSPIFQFTNTYAFKNGTIMLGQNDEFGSIGSTNNYVIYDNVRVVDLSTKITGFKIIGGNAVIDFTTPEGGSFTNYSSATVAGPYTPDAGTTITTTGVGAYRATTPVNGTTRFYQIRRTDLLP